MLTLLFGFIPTLGHAANLEKSAIPVTTQSIEQLILYPTQDAPAQSISLNNSFLSTEVSGIVMEIPVKVGQLVKKGDVLIRLDPWNYQHKVQQARALLKETQVRLQLSQREKQRTEQLRKNGQASKRQFDLNETELNSLKALIEQQRSVVQSALDTLQKCTLKAPFSGVVVERSAQIGSWTTPGSPLIRLIDLDHIELSAQIQPDQAKHFNQPLTAHFHTQNNTYPVQLRALVPTQNPTTHNQEVRSVFLDKKPQPGAVGRLVWKDPRPHLPDWLPVRRKGTLGVFFAEGQAEGQKARFYGFAHAIEAQPILLESDHPTGKVILSGRENLTDGAIITLQPDTKPE